MNSSHRAIQRVAMAVLLCGSVTAMGCLDKPTIEERWTRVDIASSNPFAHQLVTAGAALPVTMHASITYRSVLTGYAVAELRVADSLGAAAIGMSPDVPRTEMARNIDQILAHSRSLGRSARAVTGWDHLIQPLDFSFSATAPTDSASASRLFLLCYLGSGQRIELDSGADSVLITPFISDQQQVLPAGLELYVEGTPVP